MRTNLYAEFVDGKAGFAIGKAVTKTDNPPAFLKPKLNLLPGQQGILEVVMKSRLIPMQQRTAFGRWVRPVMACLLAFALTACASQPAAQDTNPAPKVQTFHELMVKLKKGFDEGTLDTPEFYARELGYPLERPETLKVIPPPYTPSRKINFDSGELAGAVASVGPIVTKDGRKHISFGSMNAIRPRDGGQCVKLAEIQATWGVVAPQPQSWGAHGPTPLTYYRYQKSIGGRERYANFDVGQRDGCVGSSYSVGQYYE
ncbi:MAG: hypothetical protein AB7P37_19180 [Ramlibacter sp.]